MVIALGAHAVIKINMTCACGSIPLAVALITAWAATTIQREARGADAAPPDASTQPARDKPKAPAGLLPIPDYTGDVWDRGFLAGDFGGTRTDWANKGIQFDVNFTQVLQSVVDGGRDTDTRYGGTLDYNLTLDLQQMGVMPGAIV